MVISIDRNEEGIRVSFGESSENFGHLLTWGCPWSVEVDSNKTGRVVLGELSKLLLRLDFYYGHGEENIQCHVRVNDDYE